MFKKDISPGARFRQALIQEHPLQIVGTINAYTALLAKRVGYSALYLSSSSVANASYGLPDVGLITFPEILSDARRIINVSDSPLLIDMGTGYGDSLAIARNIKLAQQTGVAGIHISDHMPATEQYSSFKRIVSTENMVQRISAAVEACTDENFVIMAQTNALTNEGLPAAIDRINSYIEAGADMIFFEGARELGDFRAVTSRIPVPVLASMNEFGDTPIFTVNELAQAGVSMVLYGQSAFRAMNTAALKVYDTIRQEGSQLNVLADMQMPEALADFINHYEYLRPEEELADV